MIDAPDNEEYLRDIYAVIDLIRAHEIDDALGSIESCLSNYPRSPELLLLTSVCSYHQGDIGRAIELCESAHKLAPDLQEVVDGLAVLHVLVGNHNDGLYYAKLATTLLPHPDIPDLLPLEFSNFFAALNASKPSRHYLDGLFSFNARAFADAASDFERELRINPQNDAALKKLGHTLIRLYRPTDALNVLNNCSERLPGDGEVNALIAVAHCQLANFDDAVPCCRQALADTPDSLDVAMLVLEATMFFDGQLASIHKDIVSDLNTRIRSAIRNEDISGGPIPQTSQKTINIALISNSLFDSELVSFIMPVIENLDKSRFTLTTYQQSPTGDATFSELKAKSENWRRIIDMDDDVVDLILDRAHTDIVVDLCGFSENGRPSLFAMSKNRIVTSMFCLPYGDDMAFTNLVISDSITAENDAVALHPDQTSITIDSGLVAINEPRLMGDVSPLPAAKNNYITFGGTASLKYISAETVEMWAAVLNAVPDSKLHLGYVQSASPDVKERAAAIFSNAGLSDRISVWNTDYDQRANPTYFNQIDIFLDTCSVSNPLNVCHALWMGVPVISRKGLSRRAMMGASVLNSAGKSQWIANSTGDAVAIAEKLCADFDTLSKVRETLRDDIKKSKLFDTQNYVRALEAVFEEAVQQRTAKK
jgi:predicted O-linked N-acetylglucosamine transferase (SPINDLY family)